MKKVFYTLALFGFIFQLNAQTITWDGGAGTDVWSDAMNWDSDAVPVAGDDVDLDGNTVVLTASTQVQRVYAGGSSVFTIDAGVTLTVDGFAGNDQGLEIQGSATLINNGTINISNISGGSSAQGYYNKGTTTNNGTINISNTGSHGLYVVAGLFTNASSGIISVTGVALDDSPTDIKSDNIYVDDANSGTLFGSLENLGTITVDCTTGDEGILVNDNTTFNNSGTITINKVGPDGDEAIQTEDGGVFNNNAGGLITINSSQDNGIVTKSNSTFNNNSNGTINIDAVDNDQILADAGSNFNNSGTMNLTNSGDVGVYVKGGNFTNNSTGVLNISDTDDHGIYSQNSGALLDNSGTITVTNGGSSSDGVRLNNTGEFTNQSSGILNIVTIGDDGIEIDENCVLNNNGTIDITDATDHGMDLEGTFNNNTGSLYSAYGSGDDGIRMQGGTGTAIVFNDGDIRIDNSGSHDIETDDLTFTNGANATYAPGSSPGDLVIRDNFDFGEATITFEIDDLGNFDQIDHTNNANTLTISSAKAELVWSEAYVPVVDDEFDIIAGSGTVVGPFASVMSTAAPLAYMVDYDTNTDLVKIVVEALLPVDLIHFTAEKSDRGSLLSWKTASEINNEGFDIERRNDSNDWNKIGHLRGRGESSVSAKYSFLDETPSAGTNYYRLKQKDFDGRYEYSSTVSLEFDRRDNTISVYPNPVEDILYLGHSTEIEDVEIQLYNANGILMLNQKGSLQQLAFADFNPGIYYLNITSAGSHKVHRIVKK